MGLLRFLADLKQRLWDPGALHLIRVDDMPDEIDTRLVYLVGDRSDPWCAVMTCPCGCGARIDLSLVKQDSPHWRLSTHWNRSVSVHPSIWRIRGCRSHFFLRRGRIHWAGMR
jgi:hypothetical protein